MKHRILMIAVALTCVLGLSAQSRKALRINEVMVENQSSVVNEYGERGLD